jgi:hypothetical protein
MDPKDFARQFFDMWQDSFSNSLEDPHHMKNLLQKMEQSNHFWEEEAQKTAKPAKSENGLEKVITRKLDANPNGAPHQQPARTNDHRDGTIQKLAERIEKCEQRMEVLETIIRSGFANIPEDRESRPSGERNARIQIPEGN